MTDDPSSSSLTRHQERSWLDKLIHAFSAEPKSRDDLMDIIKDAAENKLLDQEALNIIEGALDVSSLQAREIMIPRTQIVAVKIDDKPKDFLPKIIESGHSRFPVIGDSIDDVKGILLAKDLLRMMLEGTTDFSLEEILRTANIVPESKRVNVLLREFREQRYHMALVIDEYGGISGLITIEDILEEIVGNIEDETDEEVSDEHIKRVSDTDFVIKALTPIEDFNDYFEAGLSDDDFDTIGGILMQAFGHLPKRNETAEIDGFKFRVLYADNRQIHLVRLTLGDL
ncbi:CBS domain-containing protein [Gilvimarinus agarilyticus]|uniref:HlyC/CorC family transporter n=1 Tax=unclassified Gilvimarinus TaxID=2642066 RepID=UPI001C082191|nr:MULTISPECIES: transporter associated domain-containing protein [unclassified Gilvimarinus]MBU2884639.1 CBS domain-containing protein [Gilvimarinus agarilyticus]MDO6569746.1 transporter associated domain-containing protein [Gilvimarinus sp. 2_MG-2023]MDO6747440.1 transporter associated domain-containing protein [Gilvimarinus sp. 1_MG-2023]